MPRDDRAALGKGRFGERARARREREVVDACLTCFADQGCFRTTLDQVAAAVGIAKGTIYLHYPSREALLGAALDRGVRQLEETCWRVWNATATPAAGLRGVLRELVARSRRRDPVSPNALSRLRCGLTWTQGALVRDGNLEQALVPLVHAWQAVGLIDPAADPPWVARVVLALTAAHVGGDATDLAPRVAHAASPTLSPETADEIAERIAALMLGGFSPRGGRAQAARGRRPMRRHRLRSHRAHSGQEEPFPGQAGPRSGGRPGG